jgi:peptidoglycan/xylan/chitin deacetylase (PgdA/CDA1 family)
MKPFITLMYHEIIENVPREYSINRAMFERHVNHVKDAGYVVEGLDGLEKRLASNQWPERYLVITFDDGHRSNLMAAEILTKAGYNATFFLTKAFSEKRENFLNSAEIRQLAAMCHVGSHSVTHPHMAHLSTDQARYELVESKNWLEQLVGLPITSFSAPNGSISRKTVGLALQCGYTLLCNSDGWWNRCEVLATTHLVNRFTIKQSISDKSFLKILSLNQPLLLANRMRSMLVALKASIQVHR